VTKQSASGRRAAKTAKAEAKRREAEVKRAAKADKETAKALAITKATRADNLVAQLKSLIDDACEGFAASMHDAAELAFRLQDEFGLSQFKIGTAIGRSQAWVSTILKWRAAGYPQTAFGPQSKARDARRLLGPNNPAAFPKKSGSNVEPESTAPSPTITPKVPRVATLNGTTLDTSGFSSKALEQIAKVTGNDVDIEAAAEPAAPAVDPVAKEQSAKALTGFKTACSIRLPKMRGDDLQAAINYFATAAQVSDLLSPALAAKNQEIAQLNSRIEGLEAERLDKDEAVNVAVENFVTLLHDMSESEALSTLQAFGERLQAEKLIQLAPFWMSRSRTKAKAPTKH